MIFEKVFNRMDRAVVHGSTFAKNDLAMAAGLATLEVIESEGLVEKAAQTGARLLRAFEAMAGRYELVHAVRGKGLMIGIEFGPPQSLKLKAAWSLLETVNAGLFCQLITIPLFKDHKILIQVAGHANHTVKLLPALVITERIATGSKRAFDAVIAESHRVPGAVWSLGKTLADHALKARPRIEHFGRHGATDMILVGRFGAPHGVKGEVRLRSFTEQARAIAGYGPLLDARPSAVSSSRPCAP